MKVSFETYTKGKCIKTGNQQYFARTRERKRLHHRAQEVPKGCSPLSGSVWFSFCAYIIDGGGGNKQTEAAVYARKLDEETEDFRRKPRLYSNSFNLDVQVPLNFRKALQAARQEKKWTQKDLAQQINEKPTIINDYESGKAIPNQQIIGKLNRALGTQLPKIPKKKKAVE